MNQSEGPTPPLDAPRVSYILLCDAHAMVAGKHCYYGVFDRILSRDLPGVHSQAVLAVEVVGPAGEDCEVTIHYQDSEDQDVIPPVTPTGLTFSPFGLATVQVKFEGLPLPKQGIFSFKVLHAGRRIGERILYVDRLEK